MGNILLMRFRNIKEQQKVIKERERISNFLMGYLFEDSENEEAKQHFKPQTHLQLRTSVQVILEFSENFKGESLDLLKKLFYEWNLQQYVQYKLKSSLWYDVAQAIHISSELRIKEMRYYVEKHTNSSRKEIRQQAIFYLISMSKNNPLAFLSKVNQPLSLFEQIYIKDCLDNQYLGEMPQFGQFLDHSLISVRVFALKMIAEYNQFDAMEKVIPYLENEEEELRIEAICCLFKMDYPGLTDVIEKTLTSESVLVRSEILQNLQKKYRLNEFENLLDLIPEADYKNRVLHFKLANKLRQESEIYV